jgi:hypothetical protein
VYQQQEQEQEQEQQDAENPFLDPPFSRIKIPRFQVSHVQQTCAPALWTTTHFAQLTL